jgi:hypothetical protein
MRLRAPVGVLLSIALLLGSTSLASANTPAHHDQAERLYRAGLGRVSDAEGRAYWADLLAQGLSIVQVAKAMLATPEGITSSGDHIVDAYRWALGRDPEPEGYAHWLQFNPAVAVAHIADSPEHVQKTGTLPPPPPVAAATQTQAAEAPPGWVDAGHGVFVPPVLLAIRRCESNDNYLAANRFSSARGAYQFIRSSWHAYGHAARYGVPEAHLATPAQQDEAAVITWQRDGTRPWGPSRYCWS